MPPIARVRSRGAILVALAAAAILLGLAGTAERHSPSVAQASAPAGVAPWLAEARPGWRAASAIRPRRRGCVPRVVIRA